MAETKKTESTKAETKTIRLPILKDKGASQEEFYSYNFKNYIIKRGVDVEVPIELYNLIIAQQKAEDEAFLRAEDLKMKAEK